MSNILELSDICSERNPNSPDQRRRLIALLKAGADLHATDGATATSTGAECVALRGEANLDSRGFA